MNAFKETIKISAAVCAGCAITGVLLNQPNVAAGGAIVGLAPTIAFLKQDEVDRKQQTHFQQKISNFDAEIGQLKGQIERTQLELTKQHNVWERQLSETQKELSKQQKQIKTQQTCQRLHLSAIHKLQHQQKLISVTGAEQSKNLTKNGAGKKNQNFLPLTQKIDKPPVTTLPQLHLPVTRIFIDGNNLDYAIRELEIELDYEALRVELSQDSSKTTLKYYTGVSSPLTKRQERFLFNLQRLRYETVTRPIVQRSDGNWKTVGDDVKIAMDMQMEVSRGDRVILVSGDGDFVPAVEELQKRDIQVIVVSIPRMLNHELHQIANGFINLETIADKIAQYRRFDAA